MRRQSLLLLSALAACGDSREAPRVHVDTNLAVPHALLDKVTALAITVYEGASCDEATGNATADSARKVAEVALGSNGCAAPAKFCGDLQLDKSETPRVFAALGKASDGSTIATGCATATVNQDAQPVTIKMLRYLAPASCGDGVIQPTEQCEPGNTTTCDAQCQSQEILLSTGATQNGTTTGTPGTKTDPSFFWPSGSGQAGWFFSFFTDRTKGAAQLEIAMRVMSEDLTGPPGNGAPVAYTLGSLFLPNGSTFPPPQEQFAQSLPQATMLGDRIWTAFQDDNSAGSNGLDIHVRAMTVTGGADPEISAHGMINGTDGEANIQAAPAIAASGSRIFVAWEDQGAGKIAGRSLTPPATLGTQNDVSTGTGNTHVSLAKTPSGWIAVWQSGTGIKLRAIGADGTPSGGEIAVNDGGAGASAPRVAALDDGRFAVVWVANDDVFVQRFDAKGSKIAGDQVAAINDVVADGKQSAPAIAATNAAGGAYTVAWLDEGSGHVRARFLGGTGGFLFNNVDGQSHEFQASKTDGHTRATPTVASGGSGPFVAIGWEDKSSGSPGVVARRFPLPTD